MKKFQASDEYKAVFMFAPKMDDKSKAFLEENEEEKKELLRIYNDIADYQGYAERGKESIAEKYNERVERFRIKILAAGGKDGWAPTKIKIKELPSEDNLLDARASVFEASQGASKLKRISIEMEKFSSGQTVNPGGLGAFEVPSKVGFDQLKREISSFSVEVDSLKKIINGIFGPIDRDLKRFSITQSTSMLVNFSGRVSRALTTCDEIESHLESARENLYQTRKNLSDNNAFALIQSAKGSVNVIRKILQRMTP